MKRRIVSTDTPWELGVGYSRALRVGNQIFVSGTTASNERGEVVSVDPYDQAKYVLQKIGQALEAAGATMSDVVRTRMYVTNIDDWEEFGRAHGEAFAHIRPAATMVQVSRLIDRDHLIEIEVDAIIRDPED